MKHTYSGSEGTAVSEMAVVDTFTRLIFNDEGGFSPAENTIIEAFRSVDPNVLMDSHADMGQYLRNLGVREMIHLVARIREQLTAEASGAMQDAQQQIVRAGEKGGSPH